MFYALYDPTQSPSRVTGWYSVYDEEKNPGGLPYTNLPPSNMLFELTNDQWALHFNDPSGFAIENGQLIQMPFEQTGELILGPLKF